MKKYSNENKQKLEKDLKTCQNKQTKIKKRQFICKMHDRRTTIQGCEHAQPHGCQHANCEIKRARQQLLTLSGRESMLKKLIANH
jgi:hypothetical protein